MDEVRVLIRAVPLRAFPLVQLVVRREPLQPFDLVHFRVRQVILPARRPAVGHDEGRRIDHLARCAELDHIVEEWADGEGVLQPGIPVLRERHVHREVRTTFRGRREAKLVRRHDHPLSDLPITRQILLDGLGVEVVRIPPERVASVVEALDLIGSEDAWPGRIETWPNQLAGLHEVTVGDDIFRGRLRISLGGDPVRQLSQELRHLTPMHTPRDPSVCVDVHETRVDRLT